MGQKPTDPATERGCVDVQSNDRVSLGIVIMFGRHLQGEVKQDMVFCRFRFARMMVGQLMNCYDEAFRRRFP